MLQQRPDNATTRFLGWWFNWPKATVTWEEVRPFDGTTTLSILSWGDYYVHQFSPAGKKRSFRVPFKRDERDFLIDQLIEYDFLTIPSEPDEVIDGLTHAVITLGNTKGGKHQVVRRPGSGNERFDLINKMLAGLAGRFDEGRVIRPPFEPWQKGVLYALLTLLVILPYGLFYFWGRPLLASWWSASPGWFFLATTVLWMAVPGIIMGWRWWERREHVRPRLFEGALIMPFWLIAIFQGALLFELPIVGWAAALDRWGTPAVAQIEALNLSEVDEEDLPFNRRLEVEFSMVVSDEGRVENRLYLPARDGGDLEVGAELPVKYFRPRSRWIMAQREIDRAAHPLFVAISVWGSLLLLLAIATVGRPLARWVDGRL